MPSIQIDFWPGEGVSPEKVGARRDGSQRSYGLAWRWLSAPNRVRRQAISAAAPKRPQELGPLAQMTEPFEKEAPARSLPMKVPFEEEALLARVTERLAQGGG